MRTRSIVALMVGITGLVVVRPSLAGSARVVAPTEPGTLGDEVRAVKQAVLMLASTGLSRAGMWNEAAAVSRYLLADADDPFDACIAQAAITWQSSEASLGGGTFREWETLRGMATDISLRFGASVSEVSVCRAMYRRVTAHLIDLDHHASHCGSTVVVKRAMERLLLLYEAYWVAVQPGFEPNGPQTRGLTPSR